MRRAEVVELLAMTAKVQGVKTVDETTGAAWHRYLAPYDYRDGCEAVDHLVQSDRRPDQPYVFTIRDVLAEIRNIRNRRLESRRHQLPAPPANTQGTDRASLRNYQQWLNAECRAASERDWTPPPPALEAPGAQQQRPTGALVRRIAAIRSTGRGDLA